MVQRTNMYPPIQPPSLYDALRLALLTDIHSNRPLFSVEVLTFNDTHKIHKINISPSYQLNNLGIDIAANISIVSCHIRSRRFRSAASTKVISSFCSMEMMLGANS